LALFLMNGPDVEVPAAQGRRGWLAGCQAPRLSGSRTAPAPNRLWFKRFGRCADDGASGGDGFATPHRAGCCVEHPCISSITRYRVPAGSGLRMSLAREEHSAGNQSSRHDDRGGVVHVQPLVFVLSTTLRASGINCADRDYTDGYAKGTNHRDLSHPTEPVTGGGLCAESGNLSKIRRRPERPTSSQSSQLRHRTHRPGQRRVRMPSLSVVLAVSISASAIRWALKGLARFAPWQA
jgi:hypothetical protein